ncbi:hypothetical protein MAR_005430 [Mya arenaria]|uniref:Uncharacterized protein n=1 Tax=Mya arenaria TaxID=6604 RepID=A0ABY7F114_MYAAR|nr:hypothetical protein MAR_005430 [Mya arenaria]
MAAVSDVERYLIEDKTCRFTTVMELGSDGRESVSTTDAISNKVKGKARSEKVILLEKSHRVSTSDATRLRVLTIIVSWVSVIVAFVLGTIAIEIWYLDDVLGIACAVFLFVNGIRVIVKLEGLI